MASTTAADFSVEQVDRLARRPAGRRRRSSTPCRAGPRCRRGRPGRRACPRASRRSPALLRDTSDAVAAGHVARRCLVEPAVVRRRGRARRVASSASAVVRRDRRPSSGTARACGRRRPRRRPVYDRLPDVGRARGRGRPASGRRSSGVERRRARSRRRCVVAAGIPSVEREVGRDLLHPRRRRGRRESVGGRRGVRAVAGAATPSGVAMIATAATPPTAARALLRRRIRVPRRRTSAAGSGFMVSPGVVKFSSSSDRVTHGSVLPRRRAVRRAPRDRG